jgi:hypothetical protein
MALASRHEESDMARSFLPSLAKLITWFVLMSGLVIAAGCHQRQPENPFQEPYGAATNTPYGG